MYKTSLSHKAFHVYFHDQPTLYVKLFRFRPKESQVKLEYQNSQLGNLPCLIMFAYLYIYTPFYMYMYICIFFVLKKQFCTSVK